MTILCTIDLLTREVFLPADQRIASYDHNVDVIRFQAEPIEDFSLDLSSIKIAAQGPNNVRHDYAVDPSTVQIEEETGYITFDWPIPAGVTEMPIGSGFKYGDRGQLIFAVCAEIISGSTVSKAWHSDDGIITVVAHLEPESGGGEDPSETATNAQKIGQLQADVAVINTQVGALANGSPTPVSTVAKMTDESAVYLYTGSESGYTAGNWYFWNGSAWTSGGTYGGAVIDTTLSISGAAADSKKTGDEISALKEDLTYNNIPYTTGTNLFDKDNSRLLYSGMYVSSLTGKKIVDSNYTAFVVPIDASKGKLSLNSTWSHIIFLSAFVDLDDVENGTVVNGIVEMLTGNGSPLEGATIPNTTSYVIVSITTSQIATAQLQYGDICTNYEPYEKVIDGQEIKKESIPLDAITRTTYTVDINGGGDYTSLLEALKNTPNNTTIHVRQGTYNVIDEYKAFYGSTFWDNYDSYNNHSDDPFYRGYWITDGRIIDCDANALFTFDYTGINTNVKTYFSPFALGKQATLKGVNISFTNTCRYAVHDDFAGYISGTPGGINTIENCVFDGGATAIGGGCGKSNTYVINNCIFLNGISGTNIFYHNNANAGAKSKLFVSNCYGNKGLEFRYYGASTKISECMASSCMFDHISCVAQAGDNSNNVNMVLYKINCTETGAA